MISVCIATYNGEKYIFDQLNSILPQLLPGDEIVISDDSSDDNTINIIESFNDKRIKLFKNQKFRSPTFNFENAIKNANGEYIFLADQDDVWYPKKVETMLCFLKFNDLVICDCHIGDDNLNIIKDSHFVWRNSRKGVFKNLFKNSYLGCCMAFKKDILNKVLPFPKTIPMFDTWIGLVCDIYYKPFFLEKKLMIYRRHSNNVTKITSNYNSTNTFYTMIKNRFNFLFALIKRILFNI